MTRLIALTLIGLIVFGFTGNSLAAQELTLDDCIQLALQNRAVIIAAYGREKLAAAGKRAALGAFLPSVRAGYDYSKGKLTHRKQDFEVVDVVPDSVIYEHIGSDSIPVVRYDTVRGPSIQEFELDNLDLGTSKSLSISGSWSVLDFSNIFTYFARRADHAAAKLDVLASEQDLIYSVKTYYYAYLANVQNLTVQEEAVKRAEEQLKLTESKFELGLVSKSDVLKQKVQHGNDRLALLRAQNAVTTSKASLAYAIGLDPRKDFDFATNFASREYSGTLDDAITYGIANKPGLLQSEKSLSAAKRYYRAAKANYLPSLSLGGSYSFFNGTQGDTATYKTSYHRQSIGFSVDWTIFDGFNREYTLSMEKVGLNNAKAQLADDRNLAITQIKTAYHDIEQYKQQKDVSVENQAAAEEDLKITQEKYNLGAATILELLDAQVSLKEAQVSLISVDFDLNLAVAQLELAMGKTD